MVQTGSSPAGDESEVSCRARRRALDKGGGAHLAGRTRALAWPTDRLAACNEGDSGEGQLAASGPVGWNEAASLDVRRLSEGIQTHRHIVHAWCGSDCKLWSFEAARGGLRVSWWSRDETRGRPARTFLALGMPLESSWSSGEDSMLRESRVRAGRVEEQASGDVVVASAGPGGAQLPTAPPLSQSRPQS